MTSIIEHAMRSALAKARTRATYDARALMRQLRQKRRSPDGIPVLHPAPRDERILRRAIDPAQAPSNAVLEHVQELPPPVEVKSPAPELQTGSWTDEHAPLLPLERLQRLNVVAAAFCDRNWSRIEQRLARLKDPRARSERADRAIYLLAVGFAKTERWCKRRRHCLESGWGARKELPKAAARAGAEYIAYLEGLLFVPGLWRCTCGCEVESTKLDEAGKVVAAPDPIKCPRCASPMKRVTERQRADELARRLKHA